MHITGAAAIVTGGASGLGAATAKALAARGAKVTIVDLNADLAASTASEIGARAAILDVTDAAAAQAVVEAAEAAHGPVRILVNCAGIAPGAKVIGRDGSPAPLADFGRAISINLVGTFNMLSQVAARLAHADPVTADGERGVIVNTASVAAFDGQIGQAAYAASKGGVVSMTLPVARELARHGIRVMTIAPGIFWTPMMAGFSAELQESLGRQVPFPSRLGRPEEYAALVESIVTNPMLNGEVIRLDGAVRMAAK